MTRLTQGLIIRYNLKKNLRKYFPNEKFGIADRCILNSIIGKQGTIGFEAFGKIMRGMENFGYQTTNLKNHLIYK